jgi:hypothetical protein
MGRAYEEDGNVIVEILAGDLIGRYFPFVPTLGTKNMSFYQALKWTAWKILNDNPTGQKYIKGKDFKYAIVEAINDKFYVSFRFTAPDLSKEPPEKESTFGE